jgi:hypothetical protein
MPLSSAVPASNGPGKTNPAATPGGRRRVTVATVAAVAGFAVTVVFYAAWQSRLPDPMATHMGSGGDADGYTSRTAFLPVAAALQLGLGLLMALTVWSARASAGGQRAMTATAVGLAAFLTYIDVMLLAANRDAADARDVRFAVWQLAAAAGAAAIAAAAGWFAAGRAPADSATADTAPPRDAGYLADARRGERLVWTRRVTSTAMAAASGILVVAGLVAGLLAGWAAGLLTGAAGLLTAAFTAVRVTVDADGVTVAYGPFPRPRTRVPLDRVTEAGTRNVRALADFGGWGYRVRPNASGVILGSGEALELRLAGGGSFVVTTPDARTAADVVNTLAARTRPAGKPAAGDPDGGTTPGTA